MDFAEGRMDRKVRGSGTLSAMISAVMEGCGGAGVW
jgi:hypothetical protein